ncbi:MAG: hypothetical protein Ta2B_07500 [Termitinemataceae bacterium]|nr:MAG: hypothetical protein Ta2B_07500 [Termitinemataceae bacterium]
MKKIISSEVIFREAAARYAAIIFYTVFGVFTIGNLKALDTQSYEFIDMLLGIEKAGKPVVFEDAVVFTAPSIYKRVSVAFAHENFSKIYTFKKLLVPINETATFDEKGKIPPELLRDSGILFYAFEVPAHVKNLEYRLIVDGLWTTDPLNSQKKFDLDSGLEFSIAPVPNIVRTYPTATENTTELSFSLQAESGAVITVAGDFNSWDPFMYELKETRQGIYTLNLPLPAGSWKYVFYKNGQQVLDPNNNERVYTYDGKIANIITLK